MISQALGTLPAVNDEAGNGPFAAFDGVLMLRLDTESSGGDRTYYVTPFVTDGDRLFVFDEPGDRSDALEELLVGNRTAIKLGLQRRVERRRRRELPDARRGSLARDACSARFFYDQALQDLAQLGGLVTLHPA